MARPSAALTGTIIWFSGCGGGSRCLVDDARCDFDSAVLDRFPADDGDTLAPGDDHVELTLGSRDDSWCIFGEGRVSPGVDRLAVVVLWSPPRWGPAPPFGLFQGWLFEGPCAGSLDPRDATLQLTSGSLDLEDARVDLDAAVGRVGDGALRGEVKARVKLDP